MPVLDIYEFSLLKLDDKFQYVWDNGNNIASVKSPDTTYMLYETQKFYAEITLVNNKIDSIECFKRGHKLDKYVEHIDLTNLTEK